MQSSGDSLQGQCTLETNIIWSLIYDAQIQTSWISCNMLLGQNFVPATELFCKSGRVTQGKLMLQHVVSTTSPLACVENLHLYTEIQKEMFKIVFLFLQICSSLISALMNCYLDDSASTDAISERLRDLCPSLFSNDDAVSTKVKTSLQESHSWMLKYHWCFYHLATCTDYACLVNFGDIQHKN